MTKVPAVATCCSDSGNPVRLSREEYCIYIGDNDFGLYNKNGHKTSMPFCMAVNRVFGDSGSIRIKLAKSLFNNTPILRYTVTSFSPDLSNPDPLWQGGSSATDVFPGTPATFGGEINGYGQISSEGLLTVTECTIFYVYDGINPIIEYAPTGSVLVRYIYAGGMHIAKIAGTDTSYYLNDALGSVRKMINEDMGNAWTGNYFPFGELTISSSYPTPRANTHGFTGKELDAEMGLNYFCQRYYDPQIGRFMILDPFGGYIELPQTQNRYAYVMNNPLKYIDPLGLDPETIPGQWHAHDMGPYGFTVFAWRPLRVNEFTSGMASGEIGPGRYVQPIPPSPEEVNTLNLGNPGFEKAKYPFGWDQPSRKASEVLDFLTGDFFKESFPTATYLLDYARRPNPKPPLMVYGNEPIAQSIQKSGAYKRFRNKLKWGYKPRSITFYEDEADLFFAFHHMEVHSFMPLEFKDQYNFNATAWDPTNMFGTYLEGNGYIDTFSIFIFMDSIR